MVIFGWGGGKLKDRGAVWPAVCPNCHNQVLFHYTTVSKSFRLYFVPIIPYGTKHYLMCPICSKGRELSAQGVLLAEKAQELLARARVGELTDEQYRFELERLRNPDAASLQPGPIQAMPPGALAQPVAPQPVGPPPGAAQATPTGPASNDPPTV